MTISDTREKIVTAADGLFYRRGYDHTSFADIASSVNISRGNFYYHFKSKDKILEAVIEKRLAKTRQMLGHWAKQDKNPKRRINQFFDILLQNRSDIMQYGCPVGTLCNELAKLGHSSQSEAEKLFSLFRTWLREQFAQLGHEAEADALAMHVLAKSQGVATLATAFGDEEFIQREVAWFNDWLDRLSPRGKDSKCS